MKDLFRHYGFEGYFDADNLQKISMQSLTEGILQSCSVLCILVCHHSCVFYPIICWLSRMTKPWVQNGESVIIITSGWDDIAGVDMSSILLENITYRSSGESVGIFIGRFVPWSFASVLQRGRHWSANDEICHWYLHGELFCLIPFLSWGYLWSRSKDSNGCLTSKVGTWFAVCYFVMYDFMFSF